MFKNAVQQGRAMGIALVLVRGRGEVGWSALATVL